MLLSNVSKLAAVVGAFAVVASVTVPGLQAAGLGGPNSALVRNAKLGQVIPPVLDDVEVMCSLLTGCKDVAFPKPADDLPGCVDTTLSALSSPDALSISLRLRQCALQANSCSQMRACALGGAKENVCAGRAMKVDKPIGFCDLDGRAVSCYHGKALFVRDCPLAGEQCSIVNGKPICSLGTCPASLAEGQATCSANHKRVLSCVQGRLKSRDCSLLGLVCEKDGSGKPQCVPPTKKCDANAPEHACQGPDALGCLLGHAVTVKCGRADMNCALPHDPDAVGVCSMGEKAGPKCKSKRPKCAGGVITYCLHGHERRFLCKAFGFRGCENTPRGPRCY